MKNTPCQFSSWGQRMFPAFRVPWLSFLATFLTASSILSGCGGSSGPQRYPVPPEPIYQGVDDPSIAARSGGEGAGGGIGGPYSSHLYQPGSDPSSMQARSDTVPAHDNMIGSRDCSVRRGGECFRPLPGLSVSGVGTQGSMEPSGSADWQVDAPPGRAPGSSAASGPATSDPVIPDAGSPARGSPVVHPVSAHHQDMTHVVRPGETLHSIAHRYDVPIPVIVQRNGLVSPQDIVVGQNLAIPKVHVERSDPHPCGGSSERPCSDVTVPMAHVPSGLTLPSIPSGYAEEARDRVPHIPPGIESPPVVPPRPGQGSESSPERQFRWPVQGRLLSKFASPPGGRSNDGINISVPEGTLVKAAEAGVIVYAGNELKGYGQLILIRHDSTWVTAYAHNSEILVRRGEHVHRGQPIAKAGRTGNVDQPQLHFEIRKDEKPVDPVPLFTEG